MKFPFTIAHISDLHLSAVHKRVNIRNTRRLLDYIGLLNVDHVVVTGDITASAEKADFELARSIFAGYGLLNTRRMSVVLGNHDIFGGVHIPEEILEFPGRCKKTNFHHKVEMFAESFGELFRETIAASERHPFPYLKPLGGLVLVGMNSVAEYSAVKNPVGSNGAVNQRGQEALHRMLSASPFKHLRKIVLIHHHFNKIRHQTDGTMQNVWKAIEQQTMKLRGKKELMKLFQKHEVEAVLHGHYHHNMEYWRKGLRFLNGGGSVLSADPDRLHVNVVQVSEEGITTRCHEVPSWVLSLKRPSVPAPTPRLPSQVAA